MKNRTRSTALLLILALAVACASVGSGDPLVVRTEDFLSNGLAVYDNAMAYHFAHSTTESPQVYKAFETARVNFPPAWQAVKDGLAAYKVNKNAGQLEGLLSAAQSILNSITPYVGGH